MTFKITAQGLNSIFGNALTDKDKILWISDGIENNVYVDPKVETILGLSRQIMYENCDAALEMLADINGENTASQVKQKLRDRLNQPPELSYATYCMHNPSGEKIFFQDSILCVIQHQQAQKKFYVGMMKIISSTEYDRNLEQPGFLYNPPPFQEVFGNMNEISLVHVAAQNIDDSHKQLQHEISIHDKVIQITPREAECLKCLAAGMSSKIIARELKISPRTVEIHIANIKRKSETNSRIELLSKIQNISDFK